MKERQAKNSHSCTVNKYRSEVGQGQKVLMFREDPQFQSYEQLLLVGDVHFFGTSFLRANKK